MIELIVYPKGGAAKLINPSPFCAKTEAFLKMCQLEYKLQEFAGNPGKFEKKKLPVIKHNGKTICDSYFIQKYLEQSFDINLDSELSEIEWSNGFAYTKMLEEFLYWSLLHERWFIDSNWQKLKDSYFKHIPSLIRGPFTAMVRGGTKKSAIGHGMSRHQDSDVIEFGKQCIRSLSIFFADKTFILGEKLTSFDATSYAFVANLIHSELGPELKKEISKYKNLLDYDERMNNDLFQDG